MVDEPDRYLNKDAIENVAEVIFAAVELEPGLYPTAALWAALPDDRKAHYRKVASAAVIETMACAFVGTLSGRKG